MAAAAKGPGLYEFLIEAELQQYYSGFKSDLKIQNVPQLKYVTEEDLMLIGMSKPEMRRLKKFFQRHYPQNYLSKFKKLILSKREESHDPVLSITNDVAEKPSIKVPNKHIIPAEAIVVNKELGQGEFGTVQQGVWTDEEDRIQVAIKCLSRERMQNNPIEFLKEAAIMHGIDHEHVVRLYGVVLDTSSLMLVTELAPLRSLLECLKEPSLRASFPVLSLCDFAIQICDGMQYLEQKRLIHRDLAARNILVFTKNKVKISDFGLSRALGVGKDYYQTNFNVNLKLPIAWCAPECISYLRFTSASDVWAYGVTLWEMFSYGFQPWAALTGQQILEAIDEPNFQRLEQPECCPREHYNVMVKCWNHDPGKRPRFCDLMSVLPECKPEQVQAAMEFVEDPSRSKRDQLAYRIGDVITVLDKQQGQGTSCWKGVVNSGKTGLFNPAHTVAYLGSNLPSNKLEFTRGDGKNAYSSKRKIRPDMISGPQGDLKHTGHVGLDGAYFGDLSFLGGKNPNLPRQIVTPYKHEDSSSLGTDSNHAEMSRTCSDISDCTPLLKTPHSEHMWVDGGKINTEHEYHEISEDEDLADSPVFNKNFDFGPSLLDEMESVLGSFGSSPTPTERKRLPPPFALPASIGVSTPPASPLAEAINVKNELKEMAAKAAGRRKQATVKPISAADEKTLDSAIAMANELTAKSMNDLDGVTPPESPHTPASPSRRKFSFRFPSVQKHASPRADRKNFTDQAACIPDIQSSLSAEAKEVYSSLVEQPVTPVEVQTILPVASHAALRLSLREREPAPSLTTFGHPAPEGGNPLRMLRSGAFPIVRPKTQKHLPKIRVPPPPPPASTEEDSSHDRASQSSDRSTQEDNPIPLPPRDRSRPSVSKPRHQRKYPLIIPGQESLDDDDVFYPQSAPTTPTVEGAALPPLPHPVTRSSLNAPCAPQDDDGFDEQIATELDALDDIHTDMEYGEEPSPSPAMVHDTEMEDHFLPVRRSRRFEEEVVETAIKPKPNVHLRQKIAQLNQMYTEPEPDLFEKATDIEFADGVDEEEAMRRNEEHVSCEDLLEFSAKAKSKSRGPDSDQVRIMTKVLGKEVTSEACLAALDATDWEVHSAIKVARLQTLLTTTAGYYEAGTCWGALSSCDGDVAKAANVLLAEHFPPDFV